MTGESPDRAASSAQGPTAEPTASESGTSEEGSRPAEGASTALTDQLDRVGRIPAAEVPSALDDLARALAERLEGLPRA